MPQVTQMLPRTPGRGGVKKRERLELREEVQVTVAEKTAALKVKAELIPPGATRTGGRASLEK